MESRFSAWWKQHCASGLNSPLVENKFFPLAQTFRSFVHILAIWGQTGCTGSGSSPRDYSLSLEQHPFLLSCTLTVGKRFPPNKSLWVHYLCRWNDYLPIPQCSTGMRLDPTASPRTLLWPKWSGYTLEPVSTECSNVQHSLPPEFTLKHATHVKLMTATQVYTKIQVGSTLISVAILAC